MRAVERSLVQPGVTDRDPVARMVALEPGVPGLGLLLDDGVLADWLHEVSGMRRVRGWRGDGPSEVRRPYLRWKPGAGGVARVQVPGGDELFLAVAHRGAAAKLRKTVQRAPGAVVALDPGRLALLARPGADRDLPGLTRLHRRGPASVLRHLTPCDDVAGDRLRAAAAGAGPVSTLAWKPQRRWVGLVGDGPDGVVVRAVRPAAAARVAAGYRAAGACLPGAVPRLLGADLERGLLVVEHLPGVTLDRRPRRGADDGTYDDAVATGRLLARLHEGAEDAPPAHAGRRVHRAEEAAAVRAAGDLLGLLVPGAGAEELADRLAHRLLRLPPEPVVTVHGDLSADQVLRRPDGTTALLDLDEAGRGPAALDLASAAAAARLNHPGSAEELVRGLHAGYAEVRPLPGADSLRTRTAAQLLRRAGEPFRSGRPGWPTEVAAAVALAAALVDGTRPHLAGAR